MSVFFVAVVAAVGLRRKDRLDVKVPGEQERETCRASFGFGLGHFVVAFCFVVFYVF